jgi:hypothetical protein
MASRVACSFMEIIIVGYLPFAVFSSLCFYAAPKTKKPTLCEWAEVSYRFFVTTSPLAQVCMAC